MSQWQYRGMQFPNSLSDSEIDEQLNAHGRHGWELISVSDRRFWFKRAIPACMMCPAEVGYAESLKPGAITWGRS